MANPKWFDAKVYAANKLDQLQKIDTKGNWTAESLTKALEEAGYKGDEGLYQHFLDYGAAENVSPNAAFDVAYYLTAKADALNNAQGGEGKAWTAGLVLDAIKEAGMTVWQHYELYGSNEGIATSEAFDTDEYLAAKAALMNETKEGGRNDWTVADVKEAFANAGLSALEHFNEYGKAELEAAGKSTTFTADILDTSSFNAFTGAQTYSLVEAMNAQKEDALASNYALSDLTAETITVAQHSGLDALISDASDAPAKSGLTYTLEDTVAAIDGASASAIAGSEGGYKILDTLANVVEGNDALVNGAATATAEITFGVKAATGETKADVVTSTVKFADVSGNTGIVLVHADSETNGVYANKGDAVVAVDGSGTTAMGSSAAHVVLDDIFTTALNNVTFNVIGSDKADYIDAHANGGVITGGKGADTITLSSSGSAADIVAYTAKSFADLKLESGSGDGAAAALPTTGGDAIANFTKANDDFQFSTAIQALLVAKGVDASKADWFVTQDFTSTSNAALTAATADGARFIFDATAQVLYLDVEGDTAQVAGSGSAGAISGATDDIIIATGISDMDAGDILFA